MDVTKEVPAPAGNTVSIAELLVIVPLFVNVEPFTFIIMLLSEATVTSELTLVPAEVVVVTVPDPPVTRFNVVALELESAKVNC